MGVAQSNGRRTPKVHSDTDEGLGGPEAQTSNDVSHVAKDRSVAPRRREGRGLSGGGKGGPGARRAKSAARDVADHPG